MEQHMVVSLSKLGLQAINAQNTLSLFKAPQEGKTTAGATLPPTIRTTSANGLNAIADLAAKLVDIKSGASSSTSFMPEYPPEIGDGQRPLTSEERAAEKANWEAFYAAQDTDVRENFSERVMEELSRRNDIDMDDPSFQAALKNRTLSIESGETIGMINPKREVFFNSDGYYAGGSLGSMETGKNFWNHVELIDGQLYSKADGKHAATGFTGQYSFYVTWPKG
jgi:hypothetical protein